jgi:hypothetical protein
MQRPIGVTVLAVLSLISGLLSLLKGLAWLGIGGFVAGTTAMVHPIAGAIIGTLAVVFGGTALFSAIFSLIFAWGAWTLKPWAWGIGFWTHAFILFWSLLAVLGPALFRERAVTILLSAIVLWYLTRPAIKLAFGKA